MKVSRIMLWWLVAMVIVVSMVGLCLSNWHWYIPLVQAESMLVAPERSGFRSPYPHCEIAANGISPNGEFAFILALYFGDDHTSRPNCLVTRSRSGQQFELPTEIDSSSLKRRGLNGIVRWAKDSAAVICFKNMDKPIGGDVVTERNAYEAGQ